MDKSLRNPMVVQVSEKEKEYLVELGLQKLLEIGKHFAQDSDTTLHIRPKKYRKTKKVVKPSRPKMSAAARAIISKRMKAMWRKKRQEKTAQ